MTFLAAAGPLVWPTLVLTAVTLWFSAMYARSREPRFAWTAASLAVATLLMAGLAAVTGFQWSVSATDAAQPEDRWLVVLGLAESLNGLVLALFACVAASVIVAFGAYRGRPSPSEA